VKNFIKKVISASAGTGKTYRLAMEYIGLLLKFRAAGIHFSEILIITFTKKATAEIRERIFQHLESIVFQKSDAAEIAGNVQSIADVAVTADEIQYLKTVYYEMLLDKHKVQISTIDSFLNTIFKTIIAPYLGITAYTIDNTLSQAMMDEIYQYLLENETNRQKVLGLFRRTGRHNMASYKSLVQSFLENRWLFDLIAGNGPKVPAESGTVEAETYYNKFFEHYLSVAKLVQQQMEDKGGLALKDVLKKDYMDLFSKKHIAGDRGLVAAIQTVLDDREEIAEQAGLFLKGEPFWNKNRIKLHDTDPGVLASLADAGQCLADYLYYTAFLPEQAELLEIARIIYSRYDEIKFREKVFSYDDISYYTFRYLYDPELSLIEGNTVTNAFYEVLAGVIRFVLIDEFQDTSIIQHRIVLPIIAEVISGPGVKEYGGAIVVGDEKQAIYGWRGGQRDLLLAMPRILFDAESTSLDTSYRSTPAIIDFINEVFGNPSLHQRLNSLDMAWPYTAIHAHRASPEGAVRVIFRNYSSSQKLNNDIRSKQDAIAEFTEQFIIPFISENKISLRDTAILTRRNDDLAEIAAVLDEHDIDYVLESSRSVLLHRAIKPVMFLFRFLVYRDFYDCLRFLRSDYVLMDGPGLKEVLKNYRAMMENGGDYAELFGQLKHYPAIGKLQKIVELYDHTSNDDEGPLLQGPVSLLSFAKNVFEQFNVTSLFGLENDVKNIHLFLELVADFENKQQKYPQNLFGFLQYCDEYGADEKMQQAGLREVEAINLLSIHKSKGLEFDNVFLFWDLSSGKGRNHGALYTFCEYSDDFTAIKNWALTYNYPEVLENSAFSDLYVKSLKTAAMEELNNIYVAMTRPRSHLCCYFAYSKDSGFEKMAEEKLAGDGFDMDILFAYSLYQQLQDRWDDASDENKLVFFTGQLAPKPAEKAPAETISLDFAGDYLNPDFSCYFVPDEQRLAKERYLDFKTTFIKNRDIDFGSLVHHYLSFIKHGGEDEKNLATSQSRMFYGSLIPVHEIDATIGILNTFIDSHGEFFSRQKWPTVFTEFVLFAPSGRELRLDRLMIDPAEKRIMVVDFKTGTVYEEEQLELYVQAVEALPFVKAQKFLVKGKYVEIKIG
jgi:ATP-dependent exoDNAse (exonuclease V) beta subunit